MANAPKMNAQQLLNQLSAKQLIHEEDIQKISSYLKIYFRGKKFPIYFHILVTFGTIISIGCFYLFLDLLGLIKLFRSHSYLYWGIGFTTTAVYAYVFQSKKNNIVQQSFFTQFSFCLIVLGKFFIVTYIYFSLPDFTGYKNAWHISLALLILTFITYPFYRVDFERFLSSLFLLFSITYNIQTTSTSVIHHDIIFNTYLILKIILAYFLLLYPKIKKNTTSIAYALLISLSFELPFFDQAISSFLLKTKHNLILLQIGLTLILVWTIFWISGIQLKNFFKNRHLFVTLLGTLSLGILTTPGILLVLLLILLGYNIQNRILLILGISLAPLYIFLYYYNLDFDLLSKSLILFGSGLILLLGASYIHLNKLDQENIS